MGFDRLNRIADSVTDVNSRLVRTVSQSTDVDGSIRPVSTPSSLSLFFSHAQALSSAGFNALSNAAISFLPSEFAPLSLPYIFYLLLLVPLECSSACALCARPFSISK
jgi:hypothetical protein